MGLRHGLYARPDLLGVVLDVRGIHFPHLASTVCLHESTLSDVLDAIRMAVDQSDSRHISDNHVLRAETRVVPVKVTVFAKTHQLVNDGERQA